MFTAFLNSKSFFTGGHSYLCYNDSGISHRKGEILMQVVHNYIAHTDSKKRITLRKSKFDYYKVQEYENGYMILAPKVLKNPAGVSDKTLEVMDKSIANLEKGKVSAPVDLSDF